MIERQAERARCPIHQQRLRRRVAASARTPAPRPRAAPSPPAGLPGTRAGSAVAPLRSQTRQPAGTRRCVSRPCPPGRSLVILAPPSLPPGSPPAPSRAKSDHRGRKSQPPSRRILATGGRTCGILNPMATARRLNRRQAASSKPYPRIPGRYRPLDFDSPRDDHEDARLWITANTEDREEISEIWGYAISSSRTPTTRTCLPRGTHERHVIDRSALNVDLRRHASERSPSGPTRSTRGRVAADTGPGGGLKPRTLRSQGEP
jgi:hypothetical protein